MQHKAEPLGKIMKKLASIIGVLFSITFASSVYATDSYWVFGSFKNVNNAMREAERIRSESGGLEIQVARFDVAGASYNRVLLRKDGNTSLLQVQAINIVPWLLEVESVVGLVSNPHPEERTQEIRIQHEPHEAEVQIARQSLDITPSHVTSPQVTPPLADESYMEYCMRKANPKERELFCTNEMLRKLSIITVPDTATETRLATAR